MSECVKPGRENKQTNKKQQEKSAEVDFWADYSSTLTHSHTNKTEDKSALIRQRRTICRERWDRSDRKNMEVLGFRRICRAHCERVTEFYCME